MKNSSLYSGKKNHKAKIIPFAPKEQAETGRPIRVINTRIFTFEEMQHATMNFAFDQIRAQGESGLVYRGSLESESHYVAIRRFECEGRTEFLAELETLSRADHPNIIKLMGYCSEGEEQLAVYEYMAKSLKNNLYGIVRKSQRLDWNMRVKIAAGVARGLEYLHYKMKPRTIHCDINCDNILLDGGYTPKLSNFRFAKVRRAWLKKDASTTFGGTEAYTAPEYSRRVTLKNDVYSFGVVLLQIFTGRQAIDCTRFRDYGVTTLGPWAQKLYKGRERKSFLQMADPELEGQYPKRGLHQVLYIAIKCVEHEARKRPSVDEIVKAFDYIESQRYDPPAQSTQGSQGASTSSSSVPLVQSAKGSHRVPRLLTALQDQSAQGFQGSQRGK